MEKNAVLDEEQQIVADISWEKLALNSLLDCAGSADVNYQRTFSLHKAKQIAASLKLAAVPPPLVSRRKTNVDVIIDGRHTRWAMVHNGVDEWMCQVCHGLTIQEEAELFLARNRNRANPKAIETFKARLISGDQTAMAIKTQCEIEGWAISSSSGVPLRTKAIDTLEDLYRASLGGNMLRITLDFIRATWGSDKRNGEAVVLFGVFQFLRAARFTDGELDSASEKLAVIPLEELIRKANYRAEMENGHPRKKMWKVIAEAYNKGKRTNRIAVDSNDR